VKKAEVSEDNEESLMVESLKDEDEEDDEDDEVGPDECVTSILRPMFTDQLLRRYVVEAIRSHLVDEDVSILQLYLSRDSNIYIDGRVKI
jgi:chromobox protein 1